ncbi:hypothetical protein FALBO_15730 [Fusarium albosuccineum]|uniref:Uncharacterized protein n=1 Tax=Fusarium albosuccineum TaxID=1237068 RepID=A0A8H4P2R4_9HYPO|nr:hypothetical protein FALBO_15730 [Fusarium albosuccineum]
MENMTTSNCRRLTTLFWATEPYQPEHHCIPSPTRGVTKLLPAGLAPSVLESVAHSLQHLLHSHLTSPPPPLPINLFSSTPSLSINSRNSVIKTPSSSPASPLSPPCSLLHLRLNRQPPTYVAATMANVPDGG